MKKNIIAALIFACAAFSVPADQVNAAAEMNAAYEGGFYPGVVRFADEILNSTASAFTARAFVLKGESLFRMGQVNEALSVLNQCKSAVSDNLELSAKRSYWMGRCLAFYENNAGALQFFYDAAAGTKNREGQWSDSGILYASSIFWSGKALFAVKDYVQCADCMEYVSENGRYFTAGEYEEALVCLAESYINSQKSEKALKLYEKTSDLELSAEAKFRLLLFYGHVLEEKGEYSAAYKKYCQVLLEGPETLAAVAMQRAYSVSSLHQAQVKEEPGSVIEKAQSRLASTPELVSEFWTRLAIDSFNAGNYQKSINYFNNAQVDASLNLKQLQLLYTTEIEFLTSDKPQKDKAVEALKNLNLGYEESGFKSGEANYAEFQVAKARYSGLAEKWKDCFELSKTQLDSSSQRIKKSAVWWNALSLYHFEKWEQSAKLIEDSGISDDEFVLLRARALGKLGRSAEADKLFYSLGQKGVLNNDGRLDYTRTLLNAGHLISTVEQAEAAAGAEALYMKGLALFNRKLWPEAEKSFAAAITGKELDSKYVSLSHFYLGYTQYQLAEWGKAYDNLLNYALTGDNINLVWNSCVTASRCAVQLGKYQEASEAAGKALARSATEEQKQEAVMLIAGVYSDWGKHDKTIETLKPYTYAKNEFAWQCSFLMAQAYVQKKDYSSADKIFHQLTLEKNGGQYAEEACYRRGELSYLQEDYDSAEKHFDSYIRKYYSGRFYSAAVYFAADCLVKTGKTDRGIMYFEQLVNGSEYSTYKYGAEKELVYLYKSSGDYSGALKMAQKMIEDYGQQAAQDNIPQLAKELRALNAGADSGLYRKEAAYEAAGGNKTPEGRKAGTELAELYASSLDGLEKAEKMALSILEQQKKNEEENQYGARSALVLAQIYRGQGKNRASASQFLTAAELSRKSGKNDAAAKALYGAAESFDAAGLSGDAALTVDSLKQLYPDSKYTALALKLIK